MRYFFHINFIVIIYMSDLDYIINKRTETARRIRCFFNSLNLCLFSESGNRRSRDVLLYVLRGPPATCTKGCHDSVRET